MANRVIWCLVQDDPIAFRITAPANAMIYDLKELIKAQCRHGILQEVDATDLKLLMLRDPMPIMPSTTLAERVRVLRSGSSDFAQELDEITDKVSDTFPEHPSDGHLYIFVVVSVSVGEKRGNNSFLDRGKEKRRRPNVLPLLAELHNELWGRNDLFDQVFRAVDLTANDFSKLQHKLHDINSSRNLKSYVSANVLHEKISFLRSETASHPLTITGSLVPSVVLAPDNPIHATDVDVGSASDKRSTQGHCKDNNVMEDAMGEQSKEDKNEDAEDDDDDQSDMDDDDKYSTSGEDYGDYEENEGEDEEEDSEGDRSYIDKDSAEVSNGSSSIFTYTLRYMDLTCLKLRYFNRVSQVLLIRDEWDAVVDIFNKRVIGLPGSAILTGQPGSGKTALLYYILVTCLIKAQPIVFQDMDGFVYTINDEVELQSSDFFSVLGDDVLTLVDADAGSCKPHRFILGAPNLRVLLTSPPRNRRDRTWLIQNVRDEHASYVVGPWQWEECAIASLFLCPYDVTLRRLRTAARFSGFIPRRLFEAVISSHTLEAAESTVRHAIKDSDDIKHAIEGVAGDLAVPLRAFMVSPGDERRKLLDCVIKPISKWVEGVIVSTLDSRDAEAIKFEGGIM